MADAARLPMQDWSNMAMFLTSDLWDHLQGTATDLKKAELLVEHLVLMGMRHPSEFTAAVITALIAPQETAAERQFALLSTVKSVIRQKVMRAKLVQQAIHGNYITALPTSFNGLDANLRAFCFPQGYCPPRRDMSMVLNAARSIPLRVTNSALPRSGSTNALTGPNMLEAMRFGAQLALSGAGSSADVIPGLQLLRPALGSSDRFASSSASLALPPSPPAPAALQGLLARAETPQLALADAPKKPIAPASSVQAQAALPLPEPAPIEEAQPLQQPTEATAADTPEPPTAGLGKVDAAVQRLAKAHYGADMPAMTAGSPSGKKRPAAAMVPAPMKKPGAAIKRPAAAAVEKGAPCKRPATAAPLGKRPAANVELALPYLSEADRMARKPNGCSKCRQRKGCTKSCWRQRGYSVD